MTVNALVTRRVALAALAAGLLGSVRGIRAETPAITMHKDPACGCCTGWAQHIRSAGFEVKIVEVADLRPVRRQLRVPTDLASCHTAQIDGYVVEGHVPASAVRRLIETRPDAYGLAAPGMPVGSPGMEGGTPVRYDVFIFGADGRRPFMQFIGSSSVP